MSQQPSPASPAPDGALFELLDRWNGGDEAALHELVRLELPWLRRYVERRLGDALRKHGDPDDFLHEVVIDLLRYTPRFRVANAGQLRRLLARIVENTLCGQHELYGRLKRQRAETLPLASDSVLELDVRRRAPSTPGGSAARREEEAWLRLALELLDAADRDVIVMREWQGASFAAIGAQLGIAENAARMRFSRALARLARQLEALRGGSY